MLVVDATQGIEAQTLANLYQALDADLTIIPVINKIDLPSARPDEVAEDVGSLLGIDPLDVIQVSAKEGVNVEQILDAIVMRVPPPMRSGTTRALAEARCGRTSSTPPTISTCSRSRDAA